MDGVDAAQAVELIRALRDQLQQMTHRLGWLEIRHDGLTQPIRLEAVALRRDIHEAQGHIGRLESRYLNVEPVSAPTTVRTVAAFRA